MKLADLRRAAVKNSSRVAFALPDGMRCVVDERGVAQIPGIKRAAAINVERELESVREFSVEGAGAVRELTREEMERWAAGAGGNAHQEDHDD